MAAGDDSSVAITAGSGTPVDTRLAANGDHRQVMAVGNAGDLVVGVEPFGALMTNTGYQTLFYDSWSTSPIDTTDKWTVTGTTPTVSAGTMTMNNTSGNGYHAIRTKDTISPNSGYFVSRNGIKLETTAATAAPRFWGLGTVATTPSATSLCQDGIGYEIDSSTGGLQAVSYAAGVKTVIATLPANSTPTGTGAVSTATVPNYRDGAFHAYGFEFRTTGVFFLIDNMQNPVASLSWPNVQVANLPALISRYNGTFVGTPVFDNTAHLTADTSKPAQAIADPVIGTRVARVNASGALQVTDLAPEIITTTTPATVATATGAIFNSRVVVATATSTTLVLAPGAGLSVYVTDVSVSNSGSTLCVVTIGPTGLTQASATQALDIVAAGTGGGGTINLQTPLKLAANTALVAVTSAASTSVYVNVNGYVAA